MSQEILFDNFLITDDIEVAREYSSATFDLKKKQIELESVSSLHTNERRIFILLIPE